MYAIYEDTLGMALVSDGAECIVISKEFFKKQMDDAYLHKLSRHVSLCDFCWLFIVSLGTYMAQHMEKRGIGRSAPHPILAAALDGLER